MLFVKATLALLALAAPAIAQDASASDSAAEGTTTGAAVQTGPSSSGNSGWNVTSFTFPRRGDADYWVNGIENQAIWNPVSSPSDLILVNWNITAFGGNRTIQTNIPGGTGSVKIPPVNYPVGTNYVLYLQESGSGRKLGVSQGFWIKINGTSPPAAYTGGAGTTTGGSGGSGGSGTTGTGSGTAAGSTSAPATTAKGSGAGALVPAGLTLALGAVAAVAAAV